ncbi:MAG TPA: hypothetical protein VII06_04805 [Chloroflexota bacterium]|jgi:hypothetical protein
MRWTVGVVTGLAVLLLLPISSASAQVGGYGAGPFGPGGPGGFGFGGPGGPFAGPGGFGFGGPGGPGGPFAAPAGQGFLGNVSQVCTDSQGNRVFVTNGGATTGYTNCVAVGGAGTTAGTGVAPIVLTATGLGGTAVSGTLTLTAATNGTFTVAGTLNGVTPGQVVTVNVPLTSGVAPLPVTATSTSVTLNNQLSGTPATGGLVTVTEANLSGNVAQGTLSTTTAGTTAGPQLCTDSQGNRVFVRSGNPATGYTNCTTVSEEGNGGRFRRFERTRGEFGQGQLAGFDQREVCTDSQGNEVLLLSGNSTTGYTNCSALP